MEYVIDTKEYETELNAIHFFMAEFLLNFGLTPKLDDYFYYNSDTGEVGYELDFAGYSARTQKENHNLIKSIQRQSPKIKLNLFVWQILHEIGHHFTLRNFTQEELIAVTKKVRRLEHNHASNPYYKLPHEVAATAWAVEYANTHQEEIKDFWKKIEPIAHALEEKVANI